MSDNNMAQRIKEMAQLSILSNRISEVQEKNLRSYPFIFFNDVIEVQIEYDLSRMVDNGPERHVTYHLKLTGHDNPHMEKRFAAIENATRLLFWKDLKVRVTVNGKLAYESKDVRPTSA